MIGVILNRLIIFLFISLFTSAVYAESDCGLDDDGFISVLDTTICPDDKTFGFFYELTPSIFEEYVFAFLDLDYEEDIKKSLRSNPEMDYRYSHLLELMIGEVSPLVLVFIITSVVITLSLGLLKSSSEGVFLGREWGHKKNIIIPLLGMILLTPISDNLFVVHLIFIFIFIGSIGLGNAFMSVYLSFFDQSVDQYLDRTSLENDNSLVSQDAYSVMNGLFVSSVCKKKSIVELSNSILESGNSSEIGTAMQCLTTDSDGYGDGFPYFISFASMPAGDSHLGHGSKDISRIKFKQGDNKPNICNLYRNIDCGELIITSPSIQNAYLNEFFEMNPHISSVVKGVIDSAKPDFNSIRSGWGTISDSLLSTMNKLSDLDIEEVKILESISYLYHRSLKLKFMLGYGSDGLLDSSIQEMSKKTDKIVDLLWSAKCVTQLEFQYAAISARNRQLGVFDENDVISLSPCYDLTSQEIYGLINGEVVDPKYITIQEVENHKNKIISDSSKIYQNELRKLTSYDLAVKDSFNVSLKEIQEKKGVSLNAIRQKGFYALGGHFLSIVSRLEFTNQLRGMFSKSYFIYSNTNNNPYISNYIELTGLEEESDYSFIYSFSEKLKPRTGVSNNIDVVNSLVSNSQLSGITGYDESGLSIMQTFNVLGSAIDEAFISLNIDDGYNESDCATKGESCFGLDRHPSLLINSIGHKLFSTGVNVVVASLVLGFFDNKIIGVATDKIKKAKTKQEQEAKKKMLEGNGAYVDRKKLKRSKSLLYFIGVVDKSISLVTGISALLGSILIVVGSVLTIVIPLISYFAFFSTYLAYIVLYVQTLFVCVLWCAYFFKPISNNESKSALSRVFISYSLNSLLRPALLVVAISIAWSIYTVATLLILYTISIGMDMANTLSQGFLLQIISSLMSLISLIILFALLTKRIYEYMNKFVNQILQNISVDEQQENDGGINALASSSAYMASKTLGMNSKLPVKYFMKK
ncbi:hypothetical protein [Photobacterium leiognathi]|uniref:hypothetical protein n=1 Tax=Photobacterium leiognathi TaxID=553611 RepID=UPI0029827D99|nr:hypothetical protein [Photobacterium leiognathi]